METSSKKLDACCMWSVQDFNAQRKKSGQIRDKKEVGANDALPLGNVASFQWHTEDTVGMATLM